MTLLNTTALNRVISALLIIILLAQPLTAFAGYDPDGVNIVDFGRFAPQVSNYQLSSSGAFTYEVPLDLPKGHSGIEVPLSLGYNSQNTNDLSEWGFGWSSSLPYIEYRNISGTDLMYDSYDFFSSMHGNLTLIATGTGQAAGLYVPEITTGATWHYDHTGAEDAWTIISPDGTTYNFGGSDAKTLKNADNNRYFRWYIDSIVDANGNSMDFSYDSSTSTNRYIEQISYSDYDLHFYSDPITPITKFSFGTPTVLDRVIDQIDVVFDGATTTRHLLSFDTSADSQRSLLASHTKQGFDGSTWTTAPATEFDYTVSNVSFQLDTSISQIPGYQSFRSGWIVPLHHINGPWPNYPQAINTSWGDTNHDGISEFFGTPVYGQVDSSWTYQYNPSSNTWTGGTTRPISTVFNHNCNCYPYINNDGPLYPGGVWIDFNGDYKINYELIDQNTGTFNPEAEVWTQIFPSDSDNDDHEELRDWRQVDLNGDGIRDGLFYNNHDGRDQWHILYRRSDGTIDEVIKPGNQFPAAFKGWSEFLYAVDWNRDGHEDLVAGPDVYLNLGNETFAEPQTFSDHYSHIPSLARPYSFRATDLNGDAYPDMAQSINDWHFNTHPFVNEATVTLQPVHSIIGSATTTMHGAFARKHSNQDTAVQTVWYADFDQDGMTDVLDGNQFYINQGTVPDRMMMVTTSDGGTISPKFKRTTELYDTNHELLNPELHTPQTIVTKVTTTDGLGQTSDITYSYEDGRFTYINNANKKFAGFAVVTETNDATNRTTKTYYHQGNGDNATTTELGDSFEKIGRSYKTEVYETSTGDLLSTTFNNWLEQSTSLGQTFVALSSTVERSHNASSNKDSATTYTYNADHQLSNETMLGEVSYNETTGQITDTGTDSRSTDISYATGLQTTLSAGTTTIDVYHYAVEQQTLKDHSGPTVSDTRFYYDGQSLGSLTDGNLSKQEAWDDQNSIWHETEYTHDTYGNVLTQTDANGNTTTYGYDSYDLYPTTITNALSQVTTNTYDYSTGEVTSSTDPNGNKTQTIFDGLDRKIEEWGTTPAGADIKLAEWAYNDTSMPRSVTETRWHTATPVHNYSYIDGLGRTIQTKAETSSGNYSTKTYSYDGAGRLVTETLPYVSSTSGYEASIPSGTPEVTTTYDALDRPLTITSPTGVESFDYNLWDVTETNKNAVQKTSKHDAFGNLIEVIEDASNLAYSTTYDFDAQDNLTKIVDAEGNEREFEFDSLSRQISAELPHVPGTAASTYTYEYDGVGNKTKEIMPDGKEIVLTYDELNRPLSKDDPTSTTTEVTYSYDTATSGVGYLASETLGHYTKTFAYDQAGNLIEEAVTTATSTQSGGGSGSSSAYDYRQEITISGQSGASTDYQVLLKVGKDSTASGADFHLHGNAQFFPTTRNDGGDLTFYDNDETTMLPFWVEKVENDIAYIWVKVSDNLDSNQNIYVYYGHSNPTNYSDGDGTFVFFDEFEGSILDTNKWFAIGAATVNVSGGVATLVGGTALASKESFGPGTSVRTNGRLAQTWTSYNSYGLIARYDPSISNLVWDSPWASFYSRWETNPAPAILTYNDNHAGGGVWSGTQTGTVFVNQFHTFEIERPDSSTQRFMLNDVEQLVTNRTATQANGFYTGQAGNNQNGSNQIDWIFARKDIATDPAYSSTSGEEALAFTHSRFARMANASSTDTDLGTAAELEEIIAELDAEQPIETEPIVEAVIEIVEATTTDYVIPTNLVSSSTGEFIQTPSNRTFSKKSYRYKELIWKLEGRITEKEQRALALENKILKTTQTIANLSVRKTKNEKRIAELEATIAKRAAKGRSTETQQERLSKNQQKLEKLVTRIQKVQNRQTTLADKLQKTQVRIDALETRVLKKQEQEALLQNADQSSSSTFRDTLAYVQTLLMQVVAFFAPETAHAQGNLQTITIQPDPTEGKDTYVTHTAGNLNTNFGNSPSAMVGHNGYWHIGLMEFDLSNLPATATAAEIQVYVPANGWAQSAVYVDKITQYWDETAVTWNASPTADLGPASAPLVAGTWSSIDITTLYNDWQAGTYPNYGVRLRPVNTGNVLNDFHSSDFVDPAMRPKLVVTYEAAPAPQPTNTHSTTWSYTDYGLLESVTTPDGKTTSYTRYNTGEIDGVTHDGQAIVSSTAYNHNEQITSRTLGNGVTETFNYDPQQEYRLTAKVTNDGSTDIQSLAYTFDAVGNVTGITDSGTVMPKTIAYDYDDLDRLTQANSTFASSTDVRNLTYSPTGNVLTADGVAYSYTDNRHPQAATAYGANVYSYDVNGNLASATRGTTTDTYSYDWNDRLAQVSRFSSVIAKYLYNAERQRTTKTVGTSTTHYLNSLTEYDGSEYTTYSFADLVRVSTNDSDGNHWNIQDHLQSSSMTLDANADLEQALDYWPFGEERENIKTGDFEATHTFTDQEKDRETNFSYMKSRYYDPELRRFTSVDPWAGDYTRPQSLNKFSYAENNPIKYTDPTGENIFNVISRVTTILTALWAGRAIHEIQDQIANGEEPNYDDVYNAMTQASVDDVPQLILENEFQSAAAIIDVTGELVGPAATEYINTGQTSLQTVQDSLVSAVSTAASHILPLGEAAQDGFSAAIENTINRQMDTDNDDDE